MDRTSFLKNYQHYQLGGLVTEQSHPLTTGLAELAQSDLNKAIEQLVEVDLKALHSLLSEAHKLKPLRQAIKNCFTQGGRVFLCGCGATGRLSLLLESLWRSKGQPSGEVVAFMAGGDVALVHSLEGFEDYPEFGARHLTDMGFQAQDLFIGISEGGETPYVIGALEEAEQISAHKPFFLFCNPSELLAQSVERSERIINHPGIESIELCVGPMALSGSTRMQASTVLQWAVGWALFMDLGEDPKAALRQLITNYQSLPMKSLKALIEKEAAIYQQGDFVMYMPRYGALTVFTDTTERSPTFSLPAFEPTHSQNKPAWCYVLLPECQSGEEAWERLLHRSPQALNWQDVSPQTSTDYLKSFDFSRQALEAREERLGDRRQYLFSIEKRKQELELTLGGRELIWPWPESHPLVGETLLKMVLNIHSTLLMGLMGRYRSNVMTWVRASNAKLVDRAARYVSQLLQEKGRDVDHLVIVNKIFDCKDQPVEGESLVESVLKALLVDKEA